MNGWREQHPEIQTDLSQAKLSSVDPSGANLEYTLLTYTYDNGPG